MALLVTSFGGFCLLAGVLVIGHIVGSFDLDLVLSAGDQIRRHSLYIPVLVLVLLGAYFAVFQQDLKGLLVYSTISHLGLTTLLVGLDTPLGVVAAIFHLMSHATFKASLFMAAGIIDHECGTDLAPWPSGKGRPGKGGPYGNRAGRLC